MKILFLSSGSDVPASRFRIQPYANELRREGHSCVVAHSFPQKYDYYPWMGFRPSQLLKRSIRWWHWLYAKMRRFDVVYIEREIFDSPSPEMELRFREVCRRIVLDIDDAVFFRYPEKFQQLLPISDLVVCGNSLIEKYVRDFNQNTQVIPTSIDFTRYTQRKRHIASELPVVGWMGTTGNLHYMQVAAEALRLTATELRFQLRLIAPDISPLSEMDLRGVSIEHRPWTPETEVTELQQMDIGLMPLAADQPWAHYKCGAKLLQYLAVGVPGIATPIGVNEEILAGNHVGYSATSTEQWANGLRSLLRDPELRNTTGQNGRDLVRRDYSIEANYPKLATALENIVATSR